MTEENKMGWYLKEWMELKDLAPARVREATGWSWGKVSEIVNGKLQYKRDTLETLAQLLEIEPFELLMKPEDAMLARTARSMLSFKNSGSIKDSD